MPDAIEIPVQKKLFRKLQEDVAVYSLENGIDLYELKSTVDAFHKRFTEALEPN